MDQQQPEAPAARPYVVVNAVGTVVNRIVWDGVTPWHPGEGLEAVPEDQFQAAPAVLDMPGADG